MSPAGSPGPAFTAPDAKALARRLDRWGTAIEDNRPAFELMIPRLREGEAQIFNSRGSAIGHPWPKAAEPDRKLNPQLLVATGALRRSLESKTSESVQHATATELRFSTLVPYAPFHQHGTSRMPARPMIGMTDEVRRAMAHAVQEASQAALR
jgi:phage gpG-like protein